MKTIIFSALLGTFAIFVFSCSSDVPFAPVEQKLLDLSKGLGFVQGVSDGSNLVAIAIRNNASDGQTYDSDQQWFYFYDNRGNPAAPSTLAVNGLNLSTTVGMQAGNSSLSWNGASHIWVVTGSGSIPTYADTISSLNRFSITEPDTKIDTVFKSLGLTVSWESPGSVDSIGIELRYLISLSRITDSTAPTTPWMLSITAPNDSGYTFTANQLATNWRQCPRRAS